MVLDLWERFLRENAFRSHPFFLFASSEHLNATKETKVLLSEIDAQRRLGKVDIEVGNKSR